MKNILFLAYRNLTRHKKRTILTSIAIAFGIGLLIWIDGLLKWADNESRRNLKKYEFGNFVITTKEYKKERRSLPINLVMEPAVINKIMEIAEKTSSQASPRTGFNSMISYKRGFGSPYLVFAIDPKLDSQVFNIKNKIIEGKYLDRTSNGVLISSYTKQELGAGVGDYITMETRTRYNSFQVLNLKVVGIFNCPNPQVNRGQMFITRHLAEAQLQVEGTVTEIVFSTKSDDNEPVFSQVKELIKFERLSGLDIETWQELGADYITLSATKKGGTKVIILFIFIIVAVGIVNTMLMAVFERIREIGMIRALGMSDSEVVWSFIAEAAGIGIIGSLCGVVLGTCISAYSIYHGLDFTKSFQDMDIGYRTGTIWYNEWNPEMILTAFIFGVFCSILVSIIPARKAVKMEITDSIRYI